MPTTITSVEKTIFCAMWTRKFDELKVGSSRSRARVTNAPRGCRSSGQLAPQPERAAATSRTSVVAERQRAEQHEPAPARHEQRRRAARRARSRRSSPRFWRSQRCSRDEQVVEEAEREAQREREDDEQRRDPRVPDEVVRRADQRGHDPREREADRQRERARSRAYIASPVEAISFRSSSAPPPARLGGEAHDRRPDAEVEHREIDRDRADERPDAERRRCRSSG